MRREISTVIIVFLLLIIVAIFSNMIFGWYVDEEIIGGEKDKNNCLGSAGYTFDKDIGACTRDWEINKDDEKMAARIAVSSDSRRGLTVVLIKTLVCEGCFSVTLVKDGEENIIKLDDWEVSEEGLLTTTECMVEGGRVVENLFDNGCEVGEKEIGCVGDCLVESICCVVE